MTHHIIRGTTMRAGYADDFGATRLRIAALNGRAYSLDLDQRTPEQPLSIDADGEIVGYCGAYGFLPDVGEIDRLAALGVMIPAER